ncbi:MAG: hypothetical protein JSV49_08750, partial [Thermoplasmata archaeon]
MREIEDAQRMIREADKIGLDTYKAKKYLKNAKVTLENAQSIEDYDESIRYASSVSSIITELQTQSSQAKELIKAAADEIAKLKKIGITIKESQDNLEQAELNYRNSDFKSSAAFAKKASKILETTNKNFNSARELLRSAHTVIEDAKSMEAEIPDVMRLYSEAASNLEKNGFETTIKLSKRIIKIAQQAKAAKLNEFQSQVNKLMAGLRKDIDTANNFGADIRKPSKIFIQVKSSIEKTDMKAAFDHIELCKNAITEARNQHKHALDKLQSARGIVKEAKEIGAKTKEAEQLILKAEEALSKFEYKNAEKQLSLAVTEAEKAREQQRTLLGLKEQAEDLIKNAKSTIKEAKDYGIIVTNVEKTLQKAEADMKNSNYYSALNLAKKAIDNCKDVQYSFIEAEENMEKAQTFVADSKIFMDTADLDEKLEESKMRIKKGNYPQAKELALKIMNRIEDIKANQQPVLIIKYPDPKPFKSHTWVKMHFEIINDGRVHAREIQLKIPEEIESRGFLTLKDIKAKDRKTIDVSLRTKEIGELPINIEVEYQNPIKNERLVSQEEIWIKTVPGEFEAPHEPGKITPEAAKEGEVKVLSEAEFYQGYIRLKVGIKNDTDTVITETKFDLEFEENLMRIDFIEPDFERRGNRVLFGNIQPKEKKTVAFYLDPLICTESSIDGNLTYKDVYGELETARMKRRKAEVVCPIFYTHENINTAMLKRLMDNELVIHDSKIYSIPSGIDFKKAIEICKKTVQAHDIKPIREFVGDDVDDPEIESWYYGLTKVKKNKVVIKASSRKKTNTIELFVACGDKQVLTGFLAELGHNLNNNLQEQGITEKPIYPITDDTIRQEILQTNSLLNHQQPDRTSLSLSKRGDEYEVTFRTSEVKGDATELSDFIKVSPDSRTDLINQINDIVTVLNIFSCTRGKVDIEDKVIKEIKTDDSTFYNDKIHDLTSLGKLIYGMFLPVPIQKHLENVNEPVILKTNDNEIPWELLHDKNDFLCLKVPIGRRLKSREIPRSNPLSQSDKT